MRSLQPLLPRFRLLAAAGRENILNNFLRTKGASFEALEIRGGNRDSLPAAFRMRIEGLTAGGVRLDTLSAGLAGNGHALDYELPQSIGHIGPFYGSFAVVLKALAYMMRLGAEGLTRAAEFASLNANYLRKKLEGVLDVPFDRICAHEFVASAPEGLRALDIAKALLDRGFHAPTVYFPLIVHECLMAEPTETESKQTLDAYIEALREIVALGKSDPQQLLDAPVKMPVRRLDETAAARHMILTEDME